MITSTALPIADPRTAEALVTTNRPALALGERREVGPASFAAILADRKPQAAPVFASRVPDAVATGESGAAPVPATAVSAISGPAGSEADIADPDLQPAPPGAADVNDQDLQNLRGAAFDIASGPPTGLAHPDPASPDPAYPDLAYPDLAYPKLAHPDQEIATLPRPPGMLDGLFSFTQYGVAGDHTGPAIPMTTADDDGVPVRRNAATALAEPPSQAPSAGLGRNAADVRAPGQEGSQAAPLVNVAIPAPAPSIRDQTVTTEPRPEAARPPAAGDVRALGPDLGALATRQVAGASPVAGNQTTLASDSRAGTESPATMAPKDANPTPTAVGANPVTLRAVSQAVSYGLTGPAAFSLTADLQEGDIARSEIGGVAASALSGSAPTHSDPGAEARLARHLVPQFAAALPDAVQGTYLQLNPEELGRVRLTVHTQDAVLILQVHADRPETADLIRRHVAELLQEFRALGYTDVSVNLGGSGQDRRPANAPWAQAGVETDSGAVNMPDNITHSQHRHGSSGLDLRL